MAIIHSFIHYTLSNPQIRCVAADILWQPSSLPCLGISSTMAIMPRSTACGIAGTGTVWNARALRTSATMCALPLG